MNNLTTYRCVSQDHDSHSTQAHCTMVPDGRLQALADAWNAGDPESAKMRQAVWAEFWPELKDLLDALEGTGDES